jgi:F-box-like
MSEFCSEGLPASLLHSSVAPCESDRILVQESIRLSKQSLDEVDQELERLKASVVELQRHRAQLEESLAHKQGILSSLRRLPPEILEEIFLQYHVGGSVSWPRSSQDHSPWTLGRVCSFWRSVYLSLPVLWSTFRFDLSGIVNESPGLRTSVADLLQTCIQRSGTGLLRFTFRTRSYSGQGSLHLDDISRNLLTLLVEASSRWYEVNLYLDDLSTCSDALSLARGKVPQLHSLRLVSKVTPTTGPGRQAIDAFSDAPRLVKISLQNIIFPTSYLQIPWNQLRYLTSKGCTFFEGEFSTILRKAHVLEEFVTEDERVLEVVPTPSSASDANDLSSNFISLSNLRNLKVVSKSSYINRIFQLFTTPALTTLSIHARTSLSSTEHILAMLQRSSACHHLRVLEIETSKEREASWLENWGILSLLRAAEGLEKCTLKVCDSAETILPTLRIEARKMGMTGRPSPSSHPALGYGTTAVHGHWNGTASVSELPFLPNLKYFELHDSWCSSTDELKAMLQSRMGGAATVHRSGDVADRMREGGIARLETVVLNLSQPKPSDLDFQEIIELSARSGAKLDLSPPM